jgi:nucleoside-diphosphate-sugar epimerase
MKILVTGASGFIGSHVVDALIARGHAVRALVQTGTLPGPLVGGPAEIAWGDVTRPADLLGACRDVEGIVHLAAVPSDWAPERLIHDVNVGGTRNLVAAALAAGCRRLVLVSSVAVHASTGHLHGREDAARDRSHPPYALSKRLAEDLVLDPRLAGRLEAVVVRPGLVPFGPRDRLFSLGAARALRAGRLPLVGGGRTRLGTAYVENLAAGLALAAQHPAAAGQTYVMGDDGTPTWAELLGALARALDAPEPRGSVPWVLAHALATGLEGLWGALGVRTPPPLTRYRVGLLRADFHFGSEKAKRELGYAPQVTWQVGVERTAAWCRDELTRQT